MAAKTQNAAHAMAMIVRIKTVSIALTFVAEIMSAMARSVTLSTNMAGGWR
jgi:hypothetical protein